MSFLDNIKSSKGQSIIFGIVGVIISYVLLTYGMKVIFPKLHLYKNQIMEKILDTKKVSVPLTIGMCNFDSSTIELNTSNSRKAAYVYLPQSNNLKGGVQFSYTFWLDVKSYNNADLSNRVIFMRGINTLMEGYDNNTPFVICPLVKFAQLSQANSEDSNTYIEIIFNTLNNPRSTIVLDQSVFNLTRSTNRNPRWFLITLTFQDYVDYNNIERGVQIESYINNNLVYTDVIKNDSLKVNNGNVYITPTQVPLESTNSFYADIRYHNYALNVVDIEKIYDKGVAHEKGACSTAKVNAAGFKEVDTDTYQRLSMTNFL